MFLYGSHPIPGGPAKVAQLPEGVVWQYINGGEWVFKQIFLRVLVFGPSKGHRISTKMWTFKDRNALSEMQEQYVLVQECGAYGQI
jgi:hypothetical protein